MKKSSEIFLFFIYLLKPLILVFVFICFSLIFIRFHFSPPPPPPPLTFIFSLFLPPFHSLSLPLAHFFPPTALSLSISPHFLNCFALISPNLRKNIFSSFDLLLVLISIQSHLRFTLSLQFNPIPAGVALFFSYDLPSIALVFCISHTLFSRAI